MKLPLDVDQIKGFLDPVEGEALYDYCIVSAELGPCLEVGSYCGKSTVYLGQACRESDTSLYAVDHHRGSEEHQLGEEYHDAELYDEQLGLLDSFKNFRLNMRAAELEETVVPIVAPSAIAAKNWATPLGMVFIDGGHSMEAAMTDYSSWSGHIVPGGILAIHDIFIDPSEGGQAPHTIYKRAISSGLFEKLIQVKTLGLLRCV
jgi:predicted O-methyltransferase YrrM|tara:strand:+ start:1710 stop:2321 length:612 start_codon:yes stop_codon:yes gene_type:complete